MLKKDKNDNWIFNYDPAIREIFSVIDKNTMKIGEIAMWAIYDSINCPILVVRGSNSDVLTSNAAKKMVEFKSFAKLVELEGIGHAPTFYHLDQINIAKKFFLEL